MRKSLRIPYLPVFSATQFCFLAYIMQGILSLAPFHLWWRKNTLKDKRKVFYEVLHIVDCWPGLFWDKVYNGKMIRQIEEFKLDDFGRKLDALY